MGNFRSKQMFSYELTVPSGGFADGTVIAVGDSLDEVLSDAFSKKLEDFCVHEGKGNGIAKLVSRERIDKVRAELGF